MARKKSAYALVDVDGGWGVGCAVQGEQGYHPVDEYGPYTDEAHARGVVDRLNARIGLTPKQVFRIVCSTMVRATVSAS